MTALVAVIVVVLIGVVAANLVRRARTGVRSVRSHHRALDTLGYITTQRPVSGAGPLAGPDSPRQAHIRILPTVVEDAPVPEEVAEEVPEEVEEVPVEVAAPVHMAAWFHLTPAPRNDLWDTAAIRQLVDGPDEADDSEAADAGEPVDIDFADAQEIAGQGVDGQVTNGTSIYDELSGASAGTWLLDHAPTDHGHSGHGHLIDAPTGHGHSGRRRLRRGFNGHRGPRAGGASGVWIGPDGPDEHRLEPSGTWPAADETGPVGTAEDGTEGGNVEDGTAEGGKVAVGTVEIDGAHQIGRQPRGPWVATPASERYQRDRRRRTRRKVEAVAAVVIIVAVAAGVVIERHHAPTRAATASAHPPTTVPLVAQPRPAAAKKTPPKAKVGVKLISNQPGSLHYQLSGAARVTLKASGPCWVEIRSGNAFGPQVYTAVLAAGATETVKAPVWVRLGRPNVVAVSVGGNAVSPPVIPGEPYNLLFD